MNPKKEVSDLIAKPLSIEDIDNLLSTNQDNFDRSVRGFRSKADELVLAQNHQKSNGLRISLECRRNSETKLELIVELINLTKVPLLFFPSGFLHENIVSWSEDANEARPAFLELLASGSNDGYQIVPNGTKSMELVFLKSGQEVVDGEENLLAHKIELKKGKNSIAFVSLIDLKYFCPVSHKKYKDIEEDAQRRKATLWTGVIMSNVIEISEI